MISKQMVAWGESGSSIREIAAYGERRAAEIGPENVYNFAIGNPSIDPPDCVQEAVERLLHTVPPTQLHAYAPAPGMASVREKVAAPCRGGSRSRPCRSRPVRDARTSRRTASAGPD